MNIDIQPCHIRCVECGTVDEQHGSSDLCAACRLSAALLQHVKNGNATVRAMTDMEDSAKHIRSSNQRSRDADRGVRAESARLAKDLGEAVELLRKAVIDYPEHISTEPIEAFLCELDKRARIAATEKKA